MDKITFITTKNFDGVLTEHAIIDRCNGEFTSMTKKTYDTLLSNSSIPQAGE
jgi:hypothetical protein